MEMPFKVSFYICLWEEPGGFCRQIKGLNNRKIAWAIQKEAGIGEGRTYTIA